MFLVALTEFWERFSYWGLAAVLVLFLTAPQAAGGWGWADAQALRLYGAYAGLGFILPVLGAWLVNTLMSERKAIGYGGTVIMAGHVSLAISTALPVAAQPASFLSGLLLILCGTALLKPAISSIVADLYPHGGSLRDEGFIYFFVAIYIGALGGGLVVGYLAARWGWHYAFGAAAVGMAFGLLGYFARQRRWLHGVGEVVRRPVRSGYERLTALEWSHVRIILVQGLFACVYSVGFFQMLGLLNLYAHRHADRAFGTFELPTAWLQTTCVWAFLFFSPLLALLWRRLERRACNPNASYKLVAGLISLAIGYWVLAGAEAAKTSATISPGWLLLAYLFFGLGDALVWAPQISLTSKLAPKRYAVAFVGGWYVFMGVGTFLAGYIGAWVQGVPFRDVFTGFSIALAIAAAMLVLYTRALKDRLSAVDIVR